MPFQVTLIPPIKGSVNPRWEILVAPEHRPSSQNNEMATLENISAYAAISLCYGYDNISPEVTETEDGGLHIRFAGGYGNFGVLEKFLEWLSNPRHYIC